MVSLNRITSRRKSGRWLKHFMIPGIFCLPDLARHSS